MCVCLVCVCIAQANKLFSIYLSIYLSIQGVNFLNYKLKQTSIISIEKVIVLHWIAVAPYFRCPKRDHLFLTGKTLETSVKTFFFGDYLFLDGKTLEISVKIFFLKITCFWTKKTLKFGCTPFPYRPEKPT